jgi:hypothetical protein
MWFLIYRKIRNFMLKYVKYSEQFFMMSSHVRSQLALPLPLAPIPAAP